MAQPLEPAGERDLSAELEALRKRIPELEQQAEALRHARSLQAALFQISEVTHTSENVQTFYARVHEIVCSLMYAENFFIAVRSPSSGELQMEYFRDSVESEVSAETINAHYSQQQLEATLFGYVMRTGQILHVDQQQTEQLARREDINVYGSDSIDWLGVPLKGREGPIGAVVVQSYDRSTLYDEEDEQLLGFVCQHIATALERRWAEAALKAANESLEEKVRDRTRALEVENRVRRHSEAVQHTLFRIAQLASESLDLDAFYAAIHEAVAELIYAPNLYVALRDDEAGMLRYPYIVDEKDIHWEDDVLPDSDESLPPTLRVLVDGEPNIYVRGKDQAPANHCGTEPACWMGVPLKLEQRTIGVIAIQSFEDGSSYDDHDKELLTFVAQHIATAIQRRQDKLALQLANDELERRVEERTRELTQANGQLRHTLEQLEDAQSQLVESEKMASLGNLVAGIAHEINTPLGVAVTAASHLEERLRRAINTDPGEAVDWDVLAGIAQEAVGLVLSNLQRASELVASFKQVAADQSTEDRRVFNLKDYLEEILRSLRPKTKTSGITLTLNCPQDIVLDSYPSAWYRIVSNLVMNSLIHAFEEGQKGRIELSVEPAGEWFIHLVYTDDGRGMNDEIRSRVFEPFFTTRRGTGGTGLGMQIVYNHVVQLGGSIRVKSAPGEGVEFFIEMPRKAREQPLVSGQSAA